MSTNKLIMLIMFLMAALITSLFVYHLKNAPERSNITVNQEVLTFPVPRELKAFTLTTANNGKFTERNLLQHWTLLFFGFSHCANICPTTLAMLNRAYQVLQPRYPNLQVVLVSLDPERDTPSVVSNYAQSFNPAFIGTSAKRQDLHKLQSQFGIYAQREQNRDNKNYQIIHTSSILLLNPQGQWVGIFKYGLSPNQFIDLFEQSVRFSQAHSIPLSNS